MGFFKKLWGGIKKVGRGIGRGFRKVGKFIVDKGRGAINLVGKGLGLIGMLPGKLGAIGRVGSTVVNGVKNVVDAIPNDKARNAINGAIDKGVTKAKEYSDEAVRKASAFRDKAAPWVTVGQRAIDGVDRLQHAIPN